MGTNYYLVSPPKRECPYCERPYKQTRLHIGKASAGWYFVFHAVPDARTVEAWRAKIKALCSIGWQIEDEYGGVQSADAFWKWMDERRALPNLNSHTKERNLFVKPEQRWFEGGCDFADYEFS